MHAEIGYPKALELLKSGGAIALFQNKPSVNKREDPLQQAKAQLEYDTARYQGSNARFKRQVDRYHV